MTVSTHTVTDKLEAQFEFRQLEAQMRAQPKFYLSFKIQAQALTETNKPNRDPTFSVGSGNEGFGFGSTDAASLCHRSGCEMAGMWVNIGRSKEGGKLQMGRI